VTGGTLLLESRHGDNPSVTADYLATLDRLTGARLQRLRYGRWVAAEGLVYDEWDRGVHVVQRFAVAPEWRRVWSVDFGFTSPATWQDWAVDGDGRMFLVSEIYCTGMLVEDLARRIRDVVGASASPEAIVCDHDAEDRRTLSRHLGLETRAAYKDICRGVDAVQSRLRRAGDGRVRLVAFADALRGRDLCLSGLPGCLAEEMDGYVWEPERDRPLKHRDHGCDAMRYAVAYVDGLRTRELVFY